MPKDKPFYRFDNGDFVEADSFDEAKQKLIQAIQNETERPENWHRCTCLGLSHRYDCPEMDGVITY